MDKNRNRDKNSTLQEATISMQEKKVRLEIEKNRIRRALYLTGGTVSLSLAILGVVVPGLPVTPLALLSAFLFAKSSERLYHWLLNNRILGPRIKNYQRRRGVTRKGKVGIIAFMGAMVLFSSFVVIHYMPVRILILSLGLIGLIVVWFFVPTAIDDPAPSGEEKDEKEV